MASENKMQEDEVILSYHNCLIRQSDRNLLVGPCWLNDIIIGFYMEYLSKTILNNDEGRKIVYASPELTQLLKMMEPGDYPAMLDSFIEKENTDIVFFPLNNCEKREGIGGSHWSLLVYSKIKQSCYHYDSSKGMNETIARSFARKILRYLLNSDCTGKFVEVDCPLQENGYDCGMFVICFVELISEQLLRQHDKIDDCDVKIVKSNVKSGRRKIIELIDQLAKKN